MSEELKEFHYEVKADRNHAQLLIEITLSSETEKAKRIVEELGANIIEMKHLSYNWLLLKLDVRDMRNIALKLGENGFSNVKGVNAVPLENQ